MYFCQNKSPWRLGEALEAVLPVRPGIRMVRRPFNHYVPVYTDWYIVPSLKLPFFQFSKFYLSWDEKVRDRIYCGYHVSKGLAPELKSVYPSRKGKRLLMDDSWGWGRFFQSVQSGDFLPRLREAAQKGGSGSATLIFTGGYVDDPGIFDPDQQNQKRDRYVLQYNAADDSFRVTGAKRDAMCLQFLNKVKNPASFANAVNHLAQEGFLWCDLFFAVPYGVRETGDFAPDEVAVTAQELYDGALAPYLDLVQ